MVSEGGDRKGGYGREWPSGVILGLLEGRLGANVRKRRRDHEKRGRFGWNAGIL